MVMSLKQHYMALEIQQEEGGGLHDGWSLWEIWKLEAALAKEKGLPYTKYHPQSKCRTCGVSIPVIISERPLHAEKPTVIDIQWYNVCYACKNKKSIQRLVEKKQNFFDVFMKVGYVPSRRLEQACRVIDHKNYEKLQKGQLPEYMSENISGLLIKQTLRRRLEEFTPMEQQVISKIITVSPHRPITMFYGPNRTGKTSLAIALAIQTEPVNMEFVTWYDLVRLASAEAGGDEDAKRDWKWIKNAGVLIIDDVTIATTATRVEDVTNLLKSRSDGKRLTLITTNLENDQLRSGIGDRIISVVDNTVPIKTKRVSPVEYGKE